MKLDSEILAKFLGAEKSNYYEYDMYGSIESIEDGPDEKHHFYPSEMRFNRDWNWIMCVVQKISGLGIGGGVLEGIKDGLIVGDIDKVNAEAIKFIRWYNLKPIESN